MDQTRCTKAACGVRGSRSQYGLDVIPLAPRTGVAQAVPVKYSDDFRRRRREGAKLDPRTISSATPTSLVLERDVFHLGAREYFQGSAVRLFGVDLMELEYRPDFVTEDEAKLMKEIAMEL